MKKIVRSALLAAAALSAFTACQQLSHVGKAVVFSASTHSTETKTVYSGVVDNDIEAIYWSDNDQVLLQSSDPDVASTPSGAASFTYSLSVDGNNRSYARLDNGNVNGLIWNESSSVSFYGVYPATTASSASGTFNMTIPSAQTYASPTATAMDHAYMVAKTSVSGSSNVTMEFYPAFTAFEIHLKNKSDAAVNPLTITRVAIASDDNNLAGDYITDVTGSAMSFTAGATQQRVVYWENPTGVSLDKTTGISFTLLALPTNVSASSTAISAANLTNLRLEITYLTNNGTSLTKKLQLKNNGSFINFAGGKKHIITGLTFDGGSSWALEINGTPLAWNGTDVNINEEVSLSGKVKIRGAIESTDSWKAEFNSKSNHYADSVWQVGGSSGYDKNYQIRILNRHLPAEKRYFKFTFTPTAPTGGYWQLLPQFRSGDTESPKHFTFKHKKAGGEIDETLAGQILNQEETIYVYPKDYDLADINIYDVWFTARFSSSPTFTNAINADSEFQDIHSDGRFSYWVFRLSQYSGTYTPNPDTEHYDDYPE